MSNQKIEIGAIIRFYSQHERNYSELNEDLKKGLVKLMSIGINNIVVVVWDSPDFHGICDYGGSYKKLLLEFSNNSKVIIAKNDLDNFVGGPNLGVELLKSRGCTHGLMVSLNIEIDTRALRAIFDVAITNGALVVAVPVEGTEQLVRKGFINNACCLWHIDTLLGVGGFDVRDIGPSHGGNNYGKSFSGLKPYGGMGECLVLPKIMSQLGRPFVFITEISAKYPVPDFNKERQANKNASKIKRIELMLADTGLGENDFSRYIL